ncbi:apicoplast ribosomal protein S8 (apicoplast) [Plasmodium berghei]|uniref:Apicoplast ribosomal protein S8 n=2 Tax=Plasmodium berghei TaxID=5821 RepID=A0A509ATB8_PLABA|nr:apicoplast ribosomal protein S8 [Plasmodium berghei]VUC58758.1 apicoplast ribosomal protein S8 [Plasmodium berghei ANKA]SCL99433.1 apicoplast ribosomal protein S8 [Plasmodium berghei]SCM16947.1 apicoplast ribosomal protein S8 [Plasmodium berghei]SCM18741.1 apicoplast ribosomal protein S8 [Plasmodium berghei]|eukprot:YP_009273036.1 apicoplast ribosomal protein S8 (apicoplast) [Plasmodium berghei]
MILRLLNKIKYNFKLNKNFILYKFNKIIYYLIILLYNYNYILKFYIIVINNRYYIFIILNKYKKIMYLKIYIRYNQLFYINYNKLISFIKLNKYFKGLLVIYSCKYKFITHILSLKYKIGGILICYIF